MSKERMLVFFAILMVSNGISGFPTLGPDEYYDISFDESFFKIPTTLPFPEVEPPYVLKGIPLRTSANSPIKGQKHYMFKNHIEDYLPMPIKPLTPIYA